MQQNWKGIGFATVGLEFAFSVLLGLGVGWWIDKKVGTGGWITLVGSAFGIAAGYRTLWTALKRANREATQEEEKQSRARREFHDDDPHDAKSPKHGRSDRND